MKKVRQWRYDSAMKTPQTSFDKAAKRCSHTHEQWQRSTWTFVLRLSAWVRKHLPFILEESRRFVAAHRLELWCPWCAVRNKNQTRQCRNPATMATGSNPEQQIDSGKVPTEMKSSDLGPKHLTSERTVKVMPVVNCFLCVD